MSEPTNNGDNRRGFMTNVWAIIIGSIVGLVPAATAACAMLAPLFGKRKSKTEFVKVGMLSEVPTDGSPIRFKVIADLWDGWSFYENEEIGGVYVRRPSETETECFTATCPHLACSVAYDRSSTNFKCPCHESVFSQQGQLLSGVSPRNMDALNVEIRDGDAGKEIWVKFQKFKTGHKEQLPQ